MTIFNYILPYQEHKITDETELLSAKYSNMEAISDHSVYTLQYQ